jgi:hypothetical protein
MSDWETQVHHFLPLPYFMLLLLQESLNTR